VCLQIMSLNNWTYYQARAKGNRSTLKRQMAKARNTVRLNVNITKVEADGWNKQYSIYPQKTFNHKRIQYMYNIAKFIKQ